MASHINRRRSSIDRAAVESILTAKETNQPSPVPSPHVGSSSSREHFPMAPPPVPTQTHTRALSYTPRPNRLSLNFPVAATTDSTRPTPTSSTAASFPPTPIEIAPSPTDPSGFLVAIAGQERRVLELKEELQKAEKSLAKLKVQWANQERTKKRAELRQAEPLLSIQTNDEQRSSEEGTRQSIELDRRKALTLLSSPREPRRKVFAGGHTRTLSLLSPERSNFTQPFPAVRELTEAGNLPRSTTMPDTSQGITRINSNRNRHSYQSGLTHGAKQVAEDLKAGMWTFLEDLRQATVGDEAVAGTGNQYVTHGTHSATMKKSSKNSLRGRSTNSPKRAGSPRTWDSLTDPNHGLGLVDASGPLWLAEPSPKASKSPIRTKSKVSKPLSFTPKVADSDDDWSNWDSPTPKSPRWSGSTDVSNPLTPSPLGAENRAVKIVDQGTPSKRGEELPWPALDSFSPGNLKRTVSTLIETSSLLVQEWEKSLSPSPGEHSNPFNETDNAPEAHEKTEQEQSISQMPLL